jgi:hypothetical protein
MTWLILLALMQSWQAGAPMPTPRFGMATAVVDGKVFAIGGGTGAYHPMTVPAVESYDPVADSWTTGYQPMPQARWFVGGAELSGKMLVIGGTDGRRTYARVDRFDPVTNTWDTLAALPEPLEGCGVCKYDDRVYVVGGYSDAESYSKRVYMFLPSTGLGRWLEVDSLGLARTIPGAAVAGGRMYAVGGKYFNHTSSVEHYADREWNRESRSMATPRAGMGLVGYDSILVAIGGVAYGGRLSTVEVLNTTGGPWYYSDPLPHDLSYPGAEFAGDKVVVMGGIQRYNAVRSVYTHVPWTGIQEPEMEPVPLPGLPTVLSGPLRLDQPLRYEVFDRTGSLVLEGTGPDQLELKRGIWFVTLVDDDTRATHKVTVVR